MTGSASVALAVAAGLLAGTGAGTADPADVPDEGRVVLTFADERIAESSGLVARDGLVLTVNDSGDGPVVYVVDEATGETVGTSTYPADPDDVEALAPGRRAGDVWVGDIGDNERARTTVAVHRLTGVGRGDRTVPAASYELRYPSRPRDAEALLVHPRTGRVLVVSKELIGSGTVYRAPARLDPGAIHRLEPVARAPRMVTDGAFLPDGRHVLLRTYGSAVLYTYPGFEVVAEAELPEQEQGEAVAVDPAGRVLVSTEGAGSEVLEVAAPTTPTPTTPTPPSAEPTASPEPETLRSDDPRTPRRRLADAADPAPGDGDGVWLPGLALAALGAVGLGLRVARRRSRRRR